jgi:hypothetical protein
VKLLIIVTSRPSNWTRRKAIRETWGHFAQLNAIRFTFLVGISTAEDQNLIDSEDLVFGDIIQGNFIDTYENLTLKTASMLEWVRDYCPEARHILKTDDDMYVNIPLLLEFADKHINDKKVIFGHLAKKWKPVRNVKSKYYVDPIQFPDRILPDFCTGPAYLITNDTVSILLEETLKSRFLRLEDVLVTGVVASKLGINRINVPEFKNTFPTKNLNPCILEKTITFHDIEPNKLYEYWATVRTKGLQCRGKLFTEFLSSQGKASG